MGIRHEHVEMVRVSPQAAFALIDDLPATARWLPPCVSLQKIGSGPNAVGDKLRYVFRQGSREQEMTGEIVAREVNARLLCRYTDAAFIVTVDLRVAPAAEGARTTHIIEIEPRTFMGRLFAPLIRMGLRKQTAEAAANLKRLLEAPAAG